jgi:hypothetical protein
MYSTTTRIALAGSVLFMGSAGAIGAVNLGAVHGSLDGGHPTGPVLRPAPGPEALAAPAEVTMPAPAAGAASAAAIHRAPAAPRPVRPTVRRPTEYRISPVTRPAEPDGARAVLASVRLEPAEYHRRADHDGCGRHRRVVEQNHEGRHSASHRHHLHHHHRSNHQQSHHHHWDGHRSEGHGGRHHLRY